MNTTNNHLRQKSDAPIRGLNATNESEKVENDCTAIGECHDGNYHPIPAIMADADFLNDPELFDISMP